MARALGLVPPPGHDEAEPDQGAGGPAEGAPRALCPAHLPPQQAGQPAGRGLA